MTEPTRDALSRRTVLKGIAGTAGLVSIPAIVAACSTPAASTAPGSAGSTAPSAPAGSAAASGGPSAATGSVTFGSNYSNKDTDTKAMQAVVDAFTAKTKIAVKVNTVDHNTFQDQISTYLQGTPDDTFTWFAGYRMRFFADQGLATDISDIWTKIGPNYSDAFKASSTGNDQKQYFIPFYNYPWVVIYRKSLFADKGYTVPKTWAEFKTLAAKMQKDGLTPLAFGDKDGWPAMGTFDILNMRINGYKYHIDLMKGAQKWTDPKTAAVFTAWKELLPFNGDISAALGRTWQDTANLLVQKKAGMYFLGTFAGQQATAQADHDDLDFFPFPTMGTAFDTELGIDAPIDGFMMTKKSPTLAADLDASKAFLEYLASGEAQVTFLVANPNSVAAAKDADTSKYSAFQKKSAEIIGASGAIAQFLDRDTDPAFAKQMQSFLQTWLTKPDQDLNAYLKSIQDFWDSLGIA
ncbi:MAG: multiple sugar transport system substrate-binding protein [Chloroflexota bacterium]|jgi:multiple sugar transport system substrate-binding protein|nr:multiple sugar transport system substrate-binding protein [Chloroflexota bacterium]MEA2652813.1 multiple sugar transport system substrate-binding protein [Chloroflexota bacterium]